MSEKAFTEGKGIDSLQLPERLLSAKNEADVLTAYGDLRKDELLATNQEAVARRLIDLGNNEMALKFFAMASDTRNTNSLIQELKQTSGASSAIAQALNKRG